MVYKGMICKGDICVWYIGCNGYGEGLGSVCENGSDMWGYYI